MIIHIAAARPPAAQCTYAGVFAGVVTAETATVLTLRDAEGKVVPVTKTDIAQRNSAPSAMPEIYAGALDALLRALPA